MPIGSRAPRPRVCFLELFSTSGERSSQRKLTTCSQKQTTHITALETEVSFDSWRIKFQTQRVNLAEMQVHCFFASTAHVDRGCKNPRRPYSLHNELSLPGYETSGISF